MLRWWGPLAIATAVVATTALPLASYKNLETGRTMTFHAGALGFVIGGGAILAAVQSLPTSSRWRFTALVVACVVLLLSACAALNSIKVANDAANRGGTGSTTAYAPGAGLVIIAAFALVVMIGVGYADGRKATASRAAIRRGAAEATASRASESSR